MSDGAPGDRPRLAVASAGPPPAELTGSAGEPVKPAAALSPPAAAPIQPSVEPDEPDLFTPRASDAGDRLLRASAGGADKGVSLAERVTAGLHRLSYRTALHRIRLRGHFPLKLLAVPPDPLRGDAAVGARIVAGRLPHGGFNPPRSLPFADPSAPAAWRDWAHSFAWLRDLAAAAERARGAAIAEPIVARWLADHAEFDAVAWAPELMARRLIFWTAYAPYILSSPDLVYRSTVLNALARMARHLDRTIDRLPDGVPRIAAAAGLNVAALLIPGVDARLARAEGLLDRALAAVVAEDGGVTDRAASTQLELIELLLQVRAAYGARSRPPAGALVAALDRLVPALAAVVMGDGGVGGWHGGGGIAPARLAAAFAASGVVARPPRAAGPAGYQRVTGGGSILVVDAAPPPQARAGGTGHAATLAFELSDGPHRLVVNCGARGLQPLPAELAAGLRTTAAHSTLVLGNSNSTRIRPDGALGRGVEEVVRRPSRERGGRLARPRPRRLCPPLRRPPSPPPVPLGRGCRLARRGQPRAGQRRPGAAARARRRRRPLPPRSRRRGDADRRWPGRFGSPRRRPGLAVPCPRRAADRRQFGLDRPRRRPAADAAAGRRRTVGRRQRQLVVQADGPLAAGDGAAPRR